MEKGRNQEDSSLSQKLVCPSPQHRLIEMSAKHKTSVMSTIPEDGKENWWITQYLLCLPQAPLVHWDIPVGPEICDRLRVPGFSRENSKYFCLSSIVGWHIICLSKRTCFLNFSGSRLKSGTISSFWMDVPLQWFLLTQLHVIKHQ